MSDPDPTSIIGTDSTLLARRLARLRALGGDIRGVVPHPGEECGARPVAHRPAAPIGRGAPNGTARRDDRARRLAQELGAVVEDGPAGPVVVLEMSLRLPLARDMLSALPFRVEADRPLLCIDTETTGLGTAAGTLPFLVGIGRWSGDLLRVRQLVLPDHPDEPAFLAALAAEIPADAWLVTYNGRSFDWPLLVARYRLQRRPAPPFAGHLDLLPVARQLWRHRLPDARLASVERGIAGVMRHGDLPGALIPERYFAYLRSGRGGLLREVLDHNRQDIVSLGHLLAELAHRLAEPSGRAEAHPGDVGALGRAFVRRRRLVEALDCYDTALASVKRDDMWARGTPAVRDGLVAERARVLVRLGRRDEAAGSWLGLAEGGGRLAAVAWLQVAKDREHRRSDVAGAMEATHHAATLAERARSTGWPLVLVEHDLARRAARLGRRLAAGQAAAAAAGSAGDQPTPTIAYASSV